jgi:ribosome-binding ATPase YchF (GTP1/OBG family)
MKVGLVGYSGSGKSTLFRWLTGVEPDPSKIQQGQTGMAHVPDERLAKMSAKFKPKKTKYAEVAVLDTPGLMRSERKDNPRRLAILREANGLVVVLDGFAATDLADQLRNFREELIFADLEIVMNRIDRLHAQLKRQARPQKEKEQDEAELALLTRIQTELEAGRTTAGLGLRPDEEKLIRSFQLLTLKPEMVFISRGDSNFGDAPPADLLALSKNPVSAPVKLEAELAELDEESRAAFMADLGLAGSSRDRVLRDLFYGMGRIVFFTVGEDECRSWAIDRGATAVEGAGAIHTDLSRGFIRAEVMSYDDFLKAGYEEKNCKSAGTFRLESKEYVVQDGDIMHIRASA